MWFRIKIAAGAWAATASLLALSRLVPDGLVRDIWLVLPMISGLFAITMSFLGAAEVGSELLGRCAQPRSAAARPTRSPQGNIPRRRKAA